MGTHILHTEKTRDLAEHNRACSVRNARAGFPYALQIKDVPVKYMILNRILVVHSVTDIYDREEETLCTTAVLRTL